MINNEEEKLKRLFISQKLFLYLLLGIVYLAFIGLQLGRIQAIADFNFTLHEIMYVPFTIAMVVAPVLFIIYIILVVMYLSKRGKQRIGVKTSIKAMLVIASLVFIVHTTAYQFQELSTTGIFEIEEKLHEDRKYYVVLDDKKVKVTFNEFQLIEENEQYLINFVWNKRTPDRGKLKTIEPIR